MSDVAVKVLVYRDGASVHARLQGPVNRETVFFFQQRLEGVTREECLTLSLDLGEVEYLDSDGIRWLQRLRESLAGRGTELRLVVRSGSRAERTLRLLQLDRSYAIDRYPLEEDAETAPAVPQR